LEKYIVYSKPDCTHCVEIERILTECGCEYEEINMLELTRDKQAELRADARLNRQTSMPLVYLNGEFVKNTIIEEMA